MSDFAVIPAAQGLVIRPLNDKLLVRPVADGIEITSEAGLRLSRASDTGTQQTQTKTPITAGKSLFDFSGWRGKPDETFTQTRQRLQQIIVDVPEAERNHARLELARFYFAQGNGEEALALLNLLVKDVPDLRQHADFISLMGASKILAYHADDGLKDLDSPLLTDQPEIELWQAVGEAERRNWFTAEEKFAITEGQLNNYPEPFFSRFNVLAIEAALAVGKDHEGADWLDRLSTAPHLRDIEPAISYLRGVLHAQGGRASAAAAAWEEAKASSDRLYKVRAELALIDLQVANNSLTPAQAADRLEALRFGWRGDDLEVDILHRLGEFYLQAQNVKAGLNSLGQAVQLYPDSPLTSKIKAEMAVAIHDVFLGDLGKKLPTLDVLTIYHQYRALMPTGTEGDAVIRNLAERLVAVDLLDQAGGLLEDLVKNRLQGEEKARVSTRLAAIRLLDHKPDLALTALDMAPADKVSLTMQNERVLLKARALSELHRDEEAMNLLKGNTHPAALMLSADISMHAQNWDQTAKTLLDLIGPPPAPGHTLTASQADWLVRCALATALAGDQTGLDKLAIDYGAAMAGTAQNDTFRVLTQPDKTAQMADIAAAQSRLSEVDMFQGFLNAYRSDKDAAPADKSGAKSATPAQQP
jgi:tetratricopeptide (TPR) repeat protein